MSEQDKLLGGTNYRYPPPYYTYSNPPPYAPPRPQAGAPPPYYPNQQLPTPTAVTVVEHPAEVTLVLPPPSDYLGHAICAVFLCFPLGIIALVLSNRVRKNIGRGDMYEAYKNSRSVRVMSRVSYLFGWLIYVGIVLCVVLPVELNINDNDNY